MSVKSPMPVTTNRLSMFFERTPSDGQTPTDWLEGYHDVLRDGLSRVDIESFATDVDIDASTLKRLQGGESVDLSVFEAAKITARTTADFDAETVAEMAHDTLLLDMTRAVIDVDVIASEIELDLDASEIQRKIEGRESMRLIEYAHVHSVLSAHLNSN